MIKIRILSENIVTEQTDVNEGKEYLEVILNYLQTDITKAVQAMNSGNTKELEKDKFDYKLFKSIEKDFDFILEKESKIRSWIKKENVGWDFQDYFHADLLEPEDQKNEEDLIEILAREKDVKVCDGTLRKRNKKNEVNFKLQTKKALRGVYRGQDKDYKEEKKGSIKFNFGLLVNYDILSNSKIIAFKSLKKKSVFNVELTKDTIRYDQTPYREGYIYGDPYFLISPQKEMTYMISFRDLGLFAECYRLIKGWAPQIDKLYKKSFSQKHMPTFRKFFGFYDSPQNIDEGIVIEQEKITLSQIIGENSVISFDFDNTLVKSYPDFDEDGELIYINGGSNATMINLMKHLIDDPSKKVYLVTSRSEEFDQKTPEQSVKAQLDKLGVQPDGIFFTNSQPKVTKLKELGVEIHFDDDRMEHGDIQGSGIQSFYPDDFLEDTNQVSKVIAVTLDNKVLILKRADTGEMDIPGGHGKSGETPEFTAIRETLEETGLDLFGIKEIMSKEVDFKGRKEQITYFYAKLNNTSEMLMDDVDLDTDENTEFYFVEPQNIDEYMPNATNNLKNVSNEIKSLTLDEQNEPFQRKMAAKHRKMKKKLIGLGGNRKKVGPYNQNPPYERSKSAPPGFGALGEAKNEEKRRIKVKINQNLDEKRKKKRKKRKKRRKTAGYGGYFPYYDLYDGSGGDSGGDGGGGE